MKEVKMGIIGTGVISKQHMELYSKIPNAKIVAACDIDKTKLEAWGKQWGVEDLYTDYREMLKRDDIDAVDVCLHNNLHTPMAIEVMRAGKHCYCEKPMAGSYADAKTLYDASKELGKELSIHLSFLFNPSSRQARKMVETGDLGHVYHARSVGYRRRLRPGLDVPPPMFSVDFLTKKWAQHGALYDMGVYHISQMLYILGVPELQRVSGSIYQELPIDSRLPGANMMEVEEMGVGFAKYENGLTLDIIETWAINMDDLGKGFIAGSKGGLRFIDEMGFRGPSVGLKYITELDGRTVETDLQVAANSITESVVDPASRFWANDQVHWIAYLSGQISERYDTAWLALQTMKVSEGIFLSSELGREVTADEIEALSVSSAIRTQETEWGTFNYEF